MMRKGHVAFCVVFASTMALPVTTSAVPISRMPAEPQSSIALRPNSVGTTVISGEETELAGFGIAIVVSPQGVIRHASQLIAR
jgi:hypothetical protein